MNKETMKYCPTCDLKYSLDENYNYPVCSNCKEDIIAEFDFDGVDWKFYWKLHILKNTLMRLIEIYKELMGMELDEEQLKLVESNMRIRENMVATSTRERC
jgi:hypothetical protein